MKVGAQARQIHRIDNAADLGAGSRFAHPFSALLTPFFGTHCIASSDAVRSLEQNDLEFSRRTAGGRLDSCLHCGLLLRQAARGPALQL